MEYKVKRISTAGIAEAISKAELYRSLNEPEEAESICRDILTIEPQHQLALRLLGLALTDQFTGSGSDRYRETEEIFQQLKDPYERLYYTGILHERRAKAQLNAGQLPRSLVALFDHAMHHFAEAEKIRPAGNDEYAISGTVSQADVSPEFRGFLPLYVELAKGNLMRLAVVRLTGPESVPIDTKLRLPAKPGRVVANAMRDVLARD